MGVFALGWLQHPLLKRQLGRQSGSSADALSGHTPLIGLSGDMLDRISGNHERILRSAVSNQNM